MNKHKETNNNILDAGLSKNKHNWICQKDGKILIRCSWSNRLQCNGCADWCFVHKASDGNYYCDTCMNKAILQNVAMAW